jgi:hypothetical protein
MTITLAGRRFRLRAGLSLAVLPDYRTAPAAFLAAVVDADALPTLSILEESTAAAAAWHVLASPSGR